MYRIIILSDYLEKGGWTSDKLAIKSYRTAAKLYANLSLKYKWIVISPNRTNVLPRTLLSIVLKIAEERA